MTYINSIVMPLILLFTSFFTAANDPEGWSALRETIEKTSFSEVSKLRDRTFDLVVPGGTNELQFGIEPENAFKVDRLAADKYRVTIINPQALVKTGLIVTYHPIGWWLKKKVPFKPNITGEASCLYEVVFSQSGVGELDLSKFDADYDVTYEISNSAAISSIKRHGKGYAIMRVPNASGETKIRLRIKKKSGDEDLQTAWINIPACKTESVVVTTPPIKTPPIITEPENTPFDVLVLKTEGISFCEEPSGLYCSTLTIRATNTSSKTVRCNTIWFYMKDGNKTIASNSQWVELNAGKSTVFEVVLKSTYRPEKFTFTNVKTDCFYK